MPKYKFEPTECEKSMNCSGCHKNKSDSEHELIHNSDIVTYSTTKISDTIPTYYELIHVYEDVENEKDGSIIPWCHYITIEQFEGFSEVEDLLGIYACGGCAFILRYIDTTKNIKTVLCTNGWKGYTDGWH